ncbi:MAG TPA: tetratricopeptide repeat protein [Pyrinomonadaceae bacterium]|nr:tetratricopeptide repeat protein [Chloracidobacterium sp.]MBK7804111.1 tetratricopeptide repeat protein [Chloracidobacterium sp.]MBL0242333.1 tetratricopeptide repeat protein [Chloracidobacterium sp.]MBP9108078.1 tetratricopeptide repeat protein [Pyrinomonadaceae bacterium]HQX56503.1 tetratricopeptide repeat protein [Pyrinomonadaceae bacterium]
MTAAQNKPHCVADVEQTTTAAQKSKDYSQALAKAEECIRRHPKSVDALIARADVYASKGDFDLAIADANKAVASSPASGEIYFRRGSIYDRRARNTFLKDEALSKNIRKEASEAAYADFDKALALDPKKGEALLVRTSLRGYFMGTGFSSLIPDLDRAVEILTKNGNTRELAEAYYQRGYTYSLEQKNDMAIADFTSAIKLNPDHVGAYSLRATVHSSPFFNPKRNIDAAIEDYTMVITLEPGAYLYSLRAALFAEKGERAKAIADYRAALALEPNNYTAKTQLAKLAPTPAPVATQPVTPRPPQPTAESFATEGRRQVSEKDYDGAIKSLTECIRLKSDAAACFAFRGYAQGMKGMMSFANADHDAAVKLSPNEPAIYFVRGMMFSELGKKAEAITEFRKVLKLDPNNKQAQSALQSLGVAPN